MALKQRIDARRVNPEQCGEIRDKTVSIRRTAKVVKGGRRFGFSALVVCGDGRGHVGYGLGKAAEVPDAIRKAGERGRKSLVKIPLRGSTIPYDVIGRFGPTEVILKPGSPGTGVIAGSVVRAIVEALGIKDIRTKVIGSTTPHNVLYAMFTALIKLREPEVVSNKRGVSIEALHYAPY